MDLKVTVDKQELPGLAAIKGFANESRFTSYQAGTLLFLGFVGKHIGRQTFNGVLRFEVLGSPQDDRCDFGPLCDVLDRHDVPDNEG